MLAPPGGGSAPVAGGAAPASGAAGANLPLVDAMDTPGAGSGMRVEVGLPWLISALAARLRCGALLWLSAPCEALQRGMNAQLPRLPSSTTDLPVDAHLALH